MEAKIDNPNPALVFVSPQPSGLSVVLTDQHSVKVMFLVLGGVASAESGTNVSNGDWYQVRLTINGFQLTSIGKNFNTCDLLYKICFNNNNT